MGRIVVFAIIVGVVAGITLSISRRKRRDED